MSADGGGGGGDSGAVVAHTIGLIEPVSEVHRAAAAGRLGGDAAGVAAFGAVGALAVRLAAAQQTLSLRVARRVLVVVAHDAADARCGVDLGPAHPTAQAAAALAAGTGATAALARAAGATVLLVDAGCESSALPALAVGLGPAGLGGAGGLDGLDGAGPGSAAVAAGIALAVSLASEGIDIAAVSSIGLDGGGDLAAGAAASRPVPTMVGLLLGMAAAGVPVLIDGARAAAAAAAAVALAPTSRGYFLGVQTGAAPWPAALEPPLVRGLGHGDGAGAALVMASLDPARALLIAGSDRCQVD